MSENNGRTNTSGGMHDGVETWDHECGCGVPHWWGPMGPEPLKERPPSEDGKS